MLECRRDECSANFPSAGFLRSFGSDPPASPPDPEGRPVDRTLLLVYLRLRGTEKNLPRASHQIYSLIPSALFLVHIWPCEKKIDGGNDQQSPICNACHVGAGEDESIPCCPTLGSLTSEHNKKKEKEIPASGRR